MTDDETGTPGVPAVQPVEQTPELAAELCRRLAEGETLAAICRDPAMPDADTVHDWVLADRDGFFARYERARLMRAHALADELLAIADDGTGDRAERTAKDGGASGAEKVQRTRLRVETRKWLLSRLLPKQFGERVAHDHTGTLTVRWGAPDDDEADCETDDRP